MDKSDIVSGIIIALGGLALFGLGASAAFESIEDDCLHAKQFRRSELIFKCELED